MWVRTVDGDAVAVDQIVQYTPEEGAATGRTVLTARRHDRHRAVRCSRDPRGADRRARAMPPRSAALDFARRHFGPVISPEGLPPAGKTTPPTAADLTQGGAS